ncbi:MAG TPA: hypothetical protein VHA12_00800 [Candidatus Nanoarchaeia archaeon]|nr:hypothetical protein [Candidatus Nanoarchaeia archaeon]
MDPIKEAFTKVRQDISDLKTSISFLMQEIEDIKRTLNEQKNTTIKPILTSQISEIPTNQQTDSDKVALYGLKSPNTQFSSGNRGVPTNRQTNQQTDQQIPSTLASTVQAVDSLKLSLKNTFLSLTKQEREVFLMLYDLEERGFTVDYPLLAQKLNLTESSIRDYVLKMIRKGVPIQKLKENNKKVFLSVAPELKKMANLASFQSLYSIKQEFIG